MQSQKDSQTAARLEPLAMETTRTEGETIIIDQGELPTNRFSLWSTIGVQYSTTTSPLSIGIYLQLVQGAGGSPYFFWCLLTAVILQSTTCLSLAEISSVYPHTAGTAYWVTVMAPSSWARFLSYLNGLSTTLAWLMATCGTLVFTGEFLTSIGAILSQSYQQQSWHVYLCLVAATSVSILLNTIWLKLLPHVTRFMVFFINAVTLFLFVSLLAKSEPKASAYTVFLDVQNTTGWSSNGVVFLIALLPGGMVVSMFDTATHLSEELPNPDRQVWQVMVITAIMNGLTTIVMCIALLFCLTHPENLLQPIGGIPILQLCWDAWPNKSFVLTVAACLAIVQIFSVTSLHFTLGRITWSFGKTGAFPFPSWTSKLNSRLQVPLNAIALVIMCSLLISLLVLGPSTIQNGIFGSAAIFFIIAYQMPIVLLLIRGRSTIPESRSFNLGRLGPIINIISILWSFVFMIFVCFPTYLPVTLNTMNWTSVCAVGLLTLGLGNWLFVHRRFHLLHGLLIEGTHDGRDMGPEDGLNKEPRSSLQGSY